MRVLAVIGWLTKQPWLAQHWSCADGMLVVDGWRLPVRVLRVADLKPWVRTNALAIA